VGKPLDGTSTVDRSQAGGLTRDEADLRDAVYRALLAEDAFRLSPEHRDALHARGLSEHDIYLGDYRTLTSSPDTQLAVYGIYMLLVRAGNGNERRIPGLFVDRINAPDGLLIPVYNCEEQIIALVVRPDDPGSGGKYRWVSSRPNRPDGPSPGSPAHVPRGIRGPVDLIRITEGQLKANVAYRLSDIPTIGFPGVDSWRRVLPILKDLRAKTVRVAFDADAPTNRNVARCLRDCIKGLQSDGYTVQLERWSIEAGKGIDDVLAAGKADCIEILSGDAVTAAAEEIAAAAGVDAQPAPDRPNEAIDDPHRLARLYVDQYGTNDGTQCLWFWRDEWQRWDGAAYRIVAGPEVRAEITRLVKIEFDAENRDATASYLQKKTTGDVKQQDDSGPPQCRKVTTGLVTNVVHALASECLLPGDINQPAWLNDNEPFPAAEVLATASGLLHLRSLIAGKPCLLPPTPAYFSGNALPYEFDPAAECPQWLRFLDSLLPDDRQSIDTLQEWFGYSLTPDTQHHKLLMLIGPPRSGKGTIARIQRGVIGEQNLASPTLASLAGPFGLWPLLGKLVALVADARLSGRADAIAVVERLLSISGEDPQDVARKNMPTLAGIRLPVRFVVMTNELPNMRDASGALTTRVILLRLTRDFRGREDKTLTRRLLRELPGILNWSIRGWQRLNERGHFEQPESGQELLDDLADLASPIGAFVRERCIVGPEFSESVRCLFSCWKKWCEEHGRDHAGTEQTFGRDLRAKIPSISIARPRIDGGDRKRIYNGIGIRE